MATTYCSSLTLTRLCVWMPHCHCKPSFPLTPWHHLPSADSNYIHTGSANLVSHLPISSSDISSHVNSKKTTHRKLNMIQFICTDIISWITVIEVKSIFPLHAGHHALGVEQKAGSTVSRASQPWSTVYITSSGAEEKSLHDCGSGAVICGWCIVQKPRAFSPAGCVACWGTLTLKDPNMKRTSVTSLMMCSSVLEKVSPNQGAVDLLFDVCCTHYY